jgi:hypothetical protein
MPSAASDLASRLARDAEAVCRYYLSSGRREGRYWLVGDVGNSPGRSLYVRLRGPTFGKGAAGKWTDAATGEHGDLLDLIAANRRLDSLRDVLEEARSFLRLPQSEPREHERQPPAPQRSPEAARRLWAMSRPIAGTVAETYLHGRGLTDLRNCGALRFHPHCYYRGDDELPGDQTRDAWPALIASVRDGGGQLTGVSRTWLALDGADKAPVTTPRRAMGNLLGHGIRFGVADDVLAAGEGSETMLSLRQVTPALPMVAATSANHLAALELTTSLRRLYIVRDNDSAGFAAAEALGGRAAAAGVEVWILDAVLGDLNDDLRRLGRSELESRVRVQLAPEDVAPLLVVPDEDHRAA